MAVNFNDTTPAAPAGKTNVKWQSDASNNASAYVDSVASALLSVIGVTMDGGGSALTAGQKGYVQVPYAGTVTGWSIVADQTGSISVEIDKHSSSAPPSAPTKPNTTTDKISASAPCALSAAATASGGTSAVSTWTTALAQWDVIGFNVASAATVQRVTLTLYVTRT